MSATDDFPFKVSRSYILFPSNKTTTRTISIKSECFNLGLMIKTVNNLPESFITDLPRNYIDNNREINITYRGADLEELPRPSDLFITFSDSFDSNNSSKVILEIVDGEEEFEAEVVQVEEQYGQENPFDCAICFETFTEQGKHAPIILGKCGHTLCYSCVMNLLRENEPLCPFDRKSIERDWNMLTVKNYNLLLLMDHEKKKPKPKIIIKKNPKFSCEETKICGDPVVPCHEDRKHESTCFCTSCQLDFCHNCFLKVHLPSKTLETHKLVSIYEKPVVLPMCRYHPRQPAALICKNNECNMFNEKYCWQCAHERHKHENPTALGRLMEQNKKALLQILRELNSKVQDFFEVVTSLEESLDRYKTAWDIRERKARTAEEKKMMEDLWYKVRWNGERCEIEDKLRSLTKMQKEMNGVLLRKTELDDIEDLMFLAKDRCTWIVGEYEHLVPKPPYEFPIEDRPDEEESTSDGEEPMSDEDGPNLYGNRLIWDEEEFFNDEDDGVSQHQQEHPIPQISRSPVQGTSVHYTFAQDTPNAARPVPQEFTPTQFRRITRETDPDYEEPTSSFYHGLFANVHVREERPLRYGRKRRILVEDEDN